MWYQGQEKDDLHRQVIAELSESAFVHYVEYLTLRQRGMRKPAFEALDAFIEQAVTWTLPQRARFADRLFGVLNTHPGCNDAIPTQLVKRLLQPTLNEWTAAEPNNPVGWRWRGLEGAGSSADDDLRTAARLDSAETIARIALIQRHYQRIDFGIHELPHDGGYCGDPDKDLAALDEVARVLTELPPSPEREACAATERELRKVVDTYLRFRAAKTGSTFRDWAAAQGLTLNSSWGPPIYYTPKSKPGDRASSKS